MLRLMAIVCLVAPLISAAEPYKPLGVGLGDSVYADAWKQTLTDLAAKGYAPVDPDPLLSATASADDYPMLWQANVVAKANAMLSDKGLKPTAVFPEKYVAAGTKVGAKRHSIDGIITDNVELQFGTTPTWGTYVDKAGDKSLSLFYRPSTGAIHSIYAQVVVAADKDPETIAHAMVNGVSSVVNLPWSATTTVNGNSVDQRKGIDATTMNTAISAVLATKSMRQSFYADCGEKTSPFIGRLTVEQLSNGCVKLGITMTKTGQGMPKPQREAKYIQFKDESTKLADAEAAKQGGGKPKGSTEGF